MFFQIYNSLFFILSWSLICSIHCSSISEFTEHNSNGDKLFRVHNSTQLDIFNLHHPTQNPIRFQFCGDTIQHVTKSQNNATGLAGGANWRLQMSDNSIVELNQVERHNQNIPGGGEEVTEYRLIWHATTGSEPVERNEICFEYGDASW